MKNLNQIFKSSNFRSIPIKDVPGGYGFELFEKRRGGKKLGNIFYRSGKVDFSPTPGVVLPDDKLDRLFLLKRQLKKYYRVQESSDLPGFYKYKGEIYRD